ncbi:MAG: hypothetical protein LBM19_00470 [Holosporales bacterium]|jgi:hypothetical protein|nr:hypothetical protein [Holosporales bacterium]
MNKKRIITKIGIAGMLLIVTSDLSCSVNRPKRRTPTAINASEAIEGMREAVRGAYEAAGIGYEPVEEVPAEFRGLSFEECMQRIHDNVKKMLRQLSVTIGGEETFSRRGSLEESRGSIVDEGTQLPPQLTIDGEETFSRRESSADPKSQGITTTGIVASVCTAAMGVLGGYCLTRRHNG